MLEMGTSGLMSGEGKRVGYQSVPITRPSSTLPRALGITFFDTAPAYGYSEERFGRFLRQL